MMLNSQLPPMLSAIPSAIFFIRCFASWRHSSFKVLKVPSSFTSLGIIFVAPLAVTLPKERPKVNVDQHFCLQFAVKQ